MAGSTLLLCYAKSLLISEFSYRLVQSIVYIGVSFMLKLGKICLHVIILYSFYLLGNWIQISLNLFIPGSVIGMILLFFLLLIKGIRLTWIEEGATFLINNLALFFIPATVGIIDYFSLFSGKGFLLIVIVLVSTAMVMSVSGRVSQRLARKGEGQQSG